MKEIKIKTMNGLQFFVFLDGKIKSTFHLLQQPRTVDEVCKVFGFYNGIGKLQYKEKYKKFTEELGVTPTKAMKLIRAAVFYQAVGPRKDLMDKFTLRKGGRNMLAVQRVLEIEPILREVVEDGLTNLEPIVYVTGKSPQELKKAMGKSLWKRICKGSRYRNEIFAKFLSQTSPTYIGIFHHLELGKVLDLSPIKMKLFRQVAITCHTEQDREWVLETIKNIEGPIGKLLEKLEMRYWFNDTVRLCYQLGEEFPHDFFNKNDSRSLRLLHDQLMTRYVEKKNEMRKEPFAFAKSVPETWEGGGVVAKRLDSAAELVAEGKTMHHCIASYEDSVRTGHYIAYHLTDGEKHATLGIRRSREDTNWKFDQMYSHCNGPVKSLWFHDLAHNIIKVLNRE